MKQYLMEYDVLLGIAAYCCLCMTIQSMTTYAYIHLIHESKQISKTKNRWLRSLAARLEACYQLRIPPQDTTAMVRNGIHNYEFLGVSLSSWRSICRQSVGFAIVLAASELALGGYYELSQRWFMVNGISLAVWLIWLLVYGDSCQLARKEEILCCQIVDYLKNTLMPRLENEYLHEEATRAYQQEYFESDRQQEEADDLEESGQAAASLDDDNLNGEIAEARRQVEAMYGQAAGLVQEIAARRVSDDAAATKELFQKKSPGQGETEQGVHINMNELKKQVESEKGQSFISTTEQVELLEEVIREYL